MKFAISILRSESNDQRDMLTACMSEVAANMVTGDAGLGEIYAPIIACTQDRIKELERAIKILNYEQNS